MMAWTSPGFTVSDSPSRMTLSSSESFTCRSLISRIPIISSTTPSVHFFWPHCPSPHAPFEADADQLLGFGHELHRQLLQHVAHEAVDHQRHRFLLRQTPLHAVEHHVLGDLRGRRLMLEMRARGLCLVIG